MRRVVIYTLEHPTTNEIRYVGRAFNPKKRYANHLCTKGNSHTSNWIKGLRLQNLKPKMAFVDECLESNWPEHEVYWISQFKTWGFDLTNHQDGGIGPTVTKEQLQGRTVWNKGKHLSEETRLKMSKSAKLVDHSYKIGRKQSSETIEKRISKTRGWLTSRSKLTKEQVNEIRNSTLGLKALSVQYNVDSKTIWNVKKYKTYQNDRI